MRDAVFRSWIKGGTQVRRKRHVRIQARFYVFLVLLALIALMLLLWVNQWNRLGTTAIVTQASLGSQYQGQIVIVRDETLYDAEGVTRVDYVAEEGSHLYKGGVICRVYSSGYNQTEINKLENYRSAIQQYHKEQVMQNYVDAQLDRLNSQIDALALEIRTVVQGQGVGSLNNLETQMTSALNSRQNYLRQKYPQDLTLSSLYQQESQQLKKIESWTTTYDAQEECIVSFYTDGYESTVNAETYEELTLSQVRSVLSGQQLETDVVSRGRTAVFRTVQPGIWYALLVSSERDWNPVLDQSYKMQLEGFDEPVDATVISFTRSGGDLLVRMEIDADVEPVLNLRTSRVVVGEFVDGVNVPVSALYVQSNMIGVVVSELGVDTFVPVTVISQNETTAFVRSIYAGSPLQPGKTVKLFN